MLDAAKTQLNLLMTMSTKLSDDMVRSRDLRYGVPYIRWPFVRGVCGKTQLNLSAIHTKIQVLRWLITTTVGWVGCTDSSHGGPRPHTLAGDAVAHHPSWGQVRAAALLGVEAAGPDLQGREGEAGRSEA